MDHETKTETPPMFGVEFATVDAGFRFTFPKDFVPAVPDQYVLSLDEDCFIKITDQQTFKDELMALEEAKKHTMHAHVLCKLWETTAQWNNKLLAQNRFAIPAVLAMVAGINPDSQIVVSYSRTGIFLASAAAFRDFQRSGAQASSDRARTIIEARMELSKEFVLPNMSSQGDR